ncbi:hypothetical protein [Streptomyces mirabilis]|uniref:hypothetical protein n=1 Tax=Streptomyces mirabilis TaxID=68239 RepID=UPI0036B2848A
MFAAAFTAQDQYPAAELIRDVLGEGLDALVDGPLVDVDLAGGVGDDEAAAGEELQDPACAGARPVGGQGPDVGLVDGGIGAEAGQQDAQAAGGETPYLFVPAPLLRVVPELVEQGLGRRGEGGQTVEFLPIFVRSRPSRFPTAMQVQSRRASNSTVWAGFTRFGEIDGAGGRAAPARCRALWCGAS